jgi:hypothetical protein
LSLVAPFYGTEVRQPSRFSALALYDCTRGIASRTITPLARTDNLHTIVYPHVSLVYACLFRLSILHKSIPASPPYVVTIFSRNTQQFIASCRLLSNPAPTRSLWPSRASPRCFLCRPFPQIDPSWPVSPKYGSLNGQQRRRIPFL